MDGFSLLGQIASQGFLGIFLALSLLTNYLLYRENRALSKEKVELVERHVAALLSVKDAYFDSLEKIKQAYADNADRTSQVINNILTIVQNLQQILNTKK